MAVAVFDPMEVSDRQPVVKRFLEGLQLSEVEQEVLLLLLAQQEGEYLVVEVDLRMEYTRWLQSGMVSLYVMETLGLGTYLEGRSNSVHLQQRQLEVVVDLLVEVPSLAVGLALCFD